jgi:hypothetical protein
MGAPVYDRPWVCAGREVYQEACRFVLVRRSSRLQAGAPVQCLQFTARESGNVPIPAGPVAPPQRS